MMTMIIRVIMIMVQMMAMIIITMKFFITHLSVSNHLHQLSQQFYQAYTYIP